MLDIALHSGSLFDLSLTHSKLNNLIRRILWVMYLNCAAPGLFFFCFVFFFSFYFISFHLDVFLHLFIVSVCVCVNDRYGYARMRLQITFSNGSFTFEGERVNFTKLEQKLKASAKPIKLWLWALLYVFTLLAKWTKVAFKYLIKYFALRLLLRFDIPQLLFTNGSAQSINFQPIDIQRANCHSSSCFVLVFGIF